MSRTLRVELVGRRAARIHPTAVVGEPAEHRDVIWAHYDGQNVPRLEPVIDETAIVGALCTVDAGIHRPTRVGARTFLMKRVHVAHDVEIGADCELGAQVCVCGEVTIGDRVQIGGNTWIKPRVTIGDGARVGGGAVVTRDIPAGEVWAGNPARPLRKGREASARGQLANVPAAEAAEDSEGGN